MTSHYRGEVCFKCEGRGCVYEPSFTHIVSTSAATDTTLYIVVCDVCKGRGWIEVPT